MDDPRRLIDQRIAIIGLGLMGGSLALALRGKCAALLGVDLDAEICALAIERGVIDQAALAPGELLPQANLVILATPALTILELIADLPGLHPGKAVVIDLGSTKVQIAAALETLPERLSPVGGHPMCGKEFSSLRYADPALYQSAPFVLTRLRNSSNHALALAEELVLALEARPVWLAADVHDRWVAATSHLPYLLANALALSVPEEAAPLVGPGFRSTARLAGSAPHMMLDVLITNRENVVNNLAEFQILLGRMEQALSTGDFTALAEILHAAGEHYAALFPLPIPSPVRTLQHGKDPE